MNFLYSSGHVRRNYGGQHQFHRVFSCFIIGASSVCSDQQWCLSHRRDSEGEASNAAVFLHTVHSSFLPISSRIMQTRQSASPRYRPSLLRNQGSDQSATLRSSATAFATALHRLRGCGSLLQLRKRQMGLHHFSLSLQLCAKTVHA